MKIQTAIERYGLPLTIRFNGEYSTRTLRRVLSKEYRNTSTWFVEDDACGTVFLPDEHAEVVIENDTRF